VPLKQLRNVAIFLDMENLFGGYGNDVTAVPLAQVMRDIEAEVVRSGLGGTIALARAYANWARPDMAAYRSQLLAGNIKPVQVFSFDHSSKNAADIELVVDALEVAADMPWIELFVIVSGDGDCAADSPAPRTGEAVLRGYHFPARCGHCQQGTAVGGRSLPCH
jgi:uncharacterized LabA/DUF88 family protein